MYALIATVSRCKTICPSI